MYLEGDDVVVLDGSSDLDGDGLADVLLTEDGALYQVSYGEAALGDADAWESEYAGFELAATGDVDGDGATDVLLGPSTQNEVVVLSFPMGAGTVATLATTRLVDDGGSTSFGDSVAAGDLDGDGADETFVGAPYAGEFFNGAVHAFAGPLAAGDLYASAQSFEVEGAGAGASAGTSAVSGRDLDGDGLDDLAFTQGDGASLLYGDTTLPVGVTSADVVIEPGARALDLGDLDGDGRADLVVGEHGGTVSVYFATATRLDDTAVPEWRSRGPGKTRTTSGLSRGSWATWTATAWTTSPSPDC